MQNKESPNGVVIWPGHGMIYDSTGATWVIDDNKCVRRNGEIYPDGECTLTLWYNQGRVYAQDVGANPFEDKWYKVRDDLDGFDDIERPSKDNTTVLPGEGHIIDSSGVRWELSPTGQVLRNREVVCYEKRLTYIHNKIYSQNTYNGRWTLWFYDGIPTAGYVELPTTTPACR